MKRLLGNLAATGFGLVVAVLVLEMIVRAIGYLPSDLLPDRRVGYRMIPNAPYRWKGEGASEGRINHEGWRDHDYTVAKPPGVTRILVLGDSYVQALQVPLDSTFHKQLERRLNAHARPGHGVDVM